MNTQLFLKQLQEHEGPPPEPDVDDDPGRLVGSGVPLWFAGALLLSIVGTVLIVAWLS